jgi:hypothetical protein
MRGPILLLLNHAMRKGGIDYFLTNCLFSPLPRLFEEDTYWTLVTALTCPSRILTMPLVSASHTSTSPLLPPAARYCPAYGPDGLKLIHCA